MIHESYVPTSRKILVIREAYSKKIDIDVDC